LPSSPDLRNSDRVRLITRNGYDWTNRYPWIVEAALKNRQKQFIIDGEAVILGRRRHS
jgi:bifunctional non-homologous end joining protein LigD